MLSALLLPVSFFLCPLYLSLLLTLSLLETVLLSLYTEWRYGSKLPIECIRLVCSLSHLSSYLSLLLSRSLPGTVPLSIPTELQLRSKLSTECMIRLVCYLHFRCILFLFLRLLCIKCCCTRGATRRGQAESWPVLVDFCVRVRTGGDRV
jgi:hypothetical protein